MGCIFLADALHTAIPFDAGYFFVAVSSFLTLWQARRAGNVEESDALYFALCEAHECPPTLEPAERYHLLVTRGLSPCAAIDFLTYDAASKTREGHLAESDELLNALDVIQKNESLAASFQWLFQKGLNLLVQTNFTGAIHFFHRATSLAPDVHQANLCQLNHLLCLENLGWDYSELLKELKAKLTSVPPSDEPALEQFEAFEFRAALRQGEWREILAQNELPLHGTQAIYHHAWFSRLPHIRFSHQENRYRDLLRALSSKADSYQQSYLMGTLTGNPSLDELNHPSRTSDKIERLYLWTWEWLLNPTAKRLDALMPIARNLVSTRKVGLSSDDAAMLQNSLLWLGLFFGVGERTIEGICAQFQFAAQNGSPLFRYEQSVLHLLYERRDSGNARPNSALTTEEKAIREISLLPTLVRRFSNRFDKDWKDFTLDLQELTKPSSRSLKTGPAVTVDLLANSLITKRTTERTLINPSLAELFCSFRHRDFVTASELMAACFGLSEYAEEIHGPKLAKLLTAANQIAAPHMRWQRKGERIYLQGDRAQLVFTRASKHVELLRHSAVSFDQVLKCGASAGMLTAAPAVPSNVLTREQLSQVLGISRASTIRRLKRWEEEKKITRVGKGKSMRYRLEKNALKEMGML